MPEVKRQLKIITTQQKIDEPSPMEDFAMRAWSIEIWLLNEQGQEVQADVFEKVVYHLHPSFIRAKQVFKKAPFRIEEKGWGEFDITITLHNINSKNVDHTLHHDLNFANERYESTHPLSFKNPKPEVVNMLSKSGPVPEENGLRGKHADAAQKNRRKDKNVDMEKLADYLQKLNEDNLLHAIKLIHDNKSNETYTKNDVENGEFHVDLYTLPDKLVRTLWDYASSKVDG